MKILVSDLDGTLIEDTRLLSQKNLEMMHKLKERGNLVVICTGRSLKEFEVIQNEIHFPCDYIILNNGALIVDKDYNVIFEKVIRKEVGLAILEKIRSYPKLCSMFSDGDHTYGFVDGKTVDYGLGGVEIQDCFYDLYKEVKQFSIIAFHQSSKQIGYTKQCYDEILKDYSHEVEAFMNTHFVDVVPKDCSKGNGVKTLLEHLNIQGEVWAIGDSHNDLSMLKVADYGYTFDYADIKDQISHQVHFAYEMIEVMLENKANDY